MYLRIILLCLLTALTCLSQNAISQVNDLDFFQEKQSDSYEKFTRPILEKLLKAIGKTDLSNPKLHIIESDYKVAEYDSEGIHISTKFIDLCQSMGEDGDDAMAYVLAHEIGHQEHNHFFAKEYGSSYASTEWGKHINNQFETVKEIGIYETEADEFGLYYSYIAGYNTFNIAPIIIDKIYAEFNLPDEMAGYPPKSYRKEQALIAQQKVEQLIPVFEIGNFLNLLSATVKGSKKQENLNNAVRTCYSHLLDQKIKTIEIYNNLGLSYLNDAIEKVELEFAMPCEMDFYSRLYIKGQSGVGMGPGADEEPEVNFDYLEELWRQIDLLTEQAIRQFEKCIQLDRNYYKAYTNLAAAYILNEEYEEAWAKAKKGLKLATAEIDLISIRNNIDLLAIIHHLNYEPKESIEYLEKSKQLNSPYYLTNYQFITGNLDTTIQRNISGIADLWSKHTPPDNGEYETINSQHPYDLIYDLFQDSSFSENWYLGMKSAEISKTIVDNETLYVYSNIGKRGRYGFYSFYYVDEKSNKSTRLNIGNGDSASQVRARYKAPINIISGNRFEYWVYIHQNIVFKIDENQNVAGWIVYDVGL